MTDTQEDQSSDIREKGYYLFMSTFTSETVSPVIRWIMSENMAVKTKPYLTLVINSPGGDLNTCFALVDVMKGSKIPIHTVGIGLIASCGLVTFIAGEPGHRILTPNTSILSHQYSWGSFGKEHELFATIKEFELTTERMINHYEKCTGLTEKEIRKELLPAEDRWLSAKQAKKLNLCDKIKETY